MEEKKILDNYGEDVIDKLATEDRVRTRPGVMFGSDDIKGAFHTVVEIVGNSLDEGRSGYGDTLYVTRHKDNSITVKDYGRGVPMGWNEKHGRYNWDLVYNELYAGGKYKIDTTIDNMDIESIDLNTLTYKFPIGLNGLGCASTQYTSEFMTVVSRRGDGYKYTKHFKKGRPIDDLVVEENTDGYTGTEVHWKVDREVFPYTNFPYRMFENYCETQAHLSELTIVLKDEIAKKEEVIKGVSIEELLKNKLKVVPKEIINKTEWSKGVEIYGNAEPMFAEVKETFEPKKKNYIAKCDCVLMITEDTQSKHMFFHNTSDVIGGVHIKAYTDTLLKYFKSIGKKEDVNVILADFDGYLSCVMSTYSNHTSFEGQTKTGVSNKFIYELVSKTLTDIIEEEVAKGSESFKWLTERVLVSAHARQKAKEITAQLKDIKGGKSKKHKSDKFYDCALTDPKLIEMTIVEGDSACKACENARDSDTQALLALKGKIINILKSPLLKVLSNKEVRDIITQMGCGVDIDFSDIKGLDIDLGGYFDIEALRYGRINILTDADVDGYQIRVLVFLLFYVLTPKIIDEGRLYIIESPLYEIIPKGRNSESIFAYTPQERSEIEKDLESKGIGIKKIHRSKGLGENDSTMLWNTTLNPKTRKSVQIKFDTSQPITRQVIDMLFGNDVSNERKEFILESLKGLKARRGII